MDDLWKASGVLKASQIDFSPAFDSFSHQGILHKPCSVGIGGSVISIVSQFLSNRSQHVRVGGFSE